MDSIALIKYLTSKENSALMDLFAQVPEDKWDWTPGDGTRSALNQMQEFATALDIFVEGMKSKKIEFDPAVFQKWVEDRSKVRTVEELQSRLDGGTAKLYAYLDTLTEADLDEDVSMPFPGEWKVADVVTYQYWNTCYHRGQINTILQLLGLGG